MNSKREVGTLFATLALDQPLGEGIFMASARLSAVWQRRFGLEASVSEVPLAGRLGELSALGAIKIAGIPVLLKAGISQTDPIESGDRSSAHSMSRTGFHAGASLLSGDVDDGVRWRFEWAHRVMPGYGGFSTLGVGLVLQFHPLGS
ncbi:MAG: hypothetical protein ABW221_00910 [Vicinamibacteria bacterium]